MCMHFVCVWPGGVGGFIFDSLLNIEREEKPIKDQIWSREH